MRTCGGQRGSGPCKKTPKIQRANGLLLVIVSVLWAVIHDFSWTSFLSLQSYPPLVKPSSEKADRQIDVIPQCTELGPHSDQGRDRGYFFTRRQAVAAAFARWR